MELPRGIMLFSLVLSVTSGPVRDNSAGLTILGLMAKDNHVCNFPPKEVLLEKSKNGFLRTCRVEFEEDLVTLNQTMEFAANDLVYLRCMGIYDLSVHICQSNFPPEALPNNTAAFSSFFNDQKHAENFCSDISKLQPFAPAKNITTHWVKLLNDYLEDEEKCTSLCKINSKRVNPLCNVLAWGRQMLARKEESDLNVEAPYPPLQRDGLIQNGEAQMESREPPTAKESSQVSTSTKVASSTKEASAASSQSSTNSASPKSAILPASSSSSSSVPVVVIDKTTATQLKNASVAQTSSSVSSKASSTQASSTAGSANSPVSSEPKKEPTSVPSKDSSKPLTPELDNNDNWNGNMENNENEAAYNDADDGDYAKNPNDLDVDPAPESNLQTKEVEFTPFTKSVPINDDESNFSSYFLTLAIICVIGYLLFHNKQKILALVLEGRKGSHGSRRRPNSSNYRKLNTNLEEAITSPAPRSTNSHVIY